MDCKKVHRFNDPSNGRSLGCVSRGALEETGKFHSSSAQRELSLARRISIPQQNTTVLILEFSFAINLSLRHSLEELTPLYYFGKTLPEEESNIRKCRDLPPGPHISSPW